MDRYIDRETKVARGNPRRGAQFYQTICSICHGFDGKEINFKTEEKPEYIGTVGQANPWETLHKIRFGQPGVGMVALTVLDIEDLVDIVAYTQTPTAEEVANWHVTFDLISASGTPLLLSPRSRGWGL
jgi:thiosulfate dehydrogenase